MYKLVIELYSNDSLTLFSIFSLHVPNPILYYQITFIVVKLITYNCFLIAAPEVIPPPVEEAPKEAQPEPPVVVEEAKNQIPKVSAGWIMKEGQNFKSWKRRFFILKEGVLTYFEKETVKGSNVGENKLGELELKGYKIERPHPEQMLLLSEKDTNARKLLLECSDDTCQKAWISALNEHIEYITKLKG